jgi:hypothetical protein
VRDPVDVEREPGADPVSSGGSLAARHDRERPAVLNAVTRPVPTVRIAARDRWPVAWAGLIGLFLVGALLKPWDTASLARAPSAPAPTGAPASNPSTGPDPLAGLRDHCQEPLGWRVYSRELWIGRQVRTWRSIEPAGRAGGPGDRAIPLVALGPFVDAIGYCSPWTGPERPPDDARISAWRNDAAGSAGGMTVLPLRAIAPDVPTVLGAVFGPPEPSRPAAGASRAPDPNSAGWPAGGYVFALRAAGWERWWAVQVAEPDESGPDPAASGNPPASRPASP